MTAPRDPHAPAAPNRRGVPPLAERMAATQQGRTVSQAAAELRVSASAVRRWIREGTLLASGPPRRRRIPLTELRRARRFLAAGRRVALTEREAEAAAMQELENEIVALVREVSAMCAALREELHAVGVMGESTPRAPTSQAERTRRRVA